MERILVTEENMELFKDKATYVKHGLEEYIYLPYWFKIENGYAIPMKYEDLPPHVIDLIREERSKPVENTYQYSVAPEPAFSHRHIDDVERMQRVMKENGIEMSLSDCAGIWEEYSDMFAAGWLSVPKDDEELFNTIKSRIS